MVSSIEIARWRERLLGVLRRLEFVGPTLARLTVGLVFVGTGWGKIHDIQRVVDFFTNDLHIPLPGFNARLVACTELIGGAAMLLGLGTRLFAVPLSITMVVAILTAKRHEIDGLTSLVGFEEWSYLVLLVWLALSGPGPLSLDHLFARRLTRNRNPKPDTHTGE
jgi:putative oxidoreductase